MKEINIIDHDVIFLSYDEPNAEKNYADLLTKVPWAKRVHGVHGSDAAHKACAKLAETERVTIVDGDNIVKSNLIEQKVTFVDEAEIDSCVISWGAQNIINGLVYGNGGIKNWPTQLVLDMRTHENSDPANSKTQVDFCWDINYIQLDNVLSWVYNNASPQQAWRAGFREGVKMGLLEGSKADPKTFTDQVHWKNLNRLMIWSHIGEDVENGIWAIYGARQGCYMTNCTDWDYTQVRDFKWLNRYWEEHDSKITDKMLPYEIMGIGETLKHELNLDMADMFTPEQSKLFKSLYTNPSRQNHRWVVK